MLGSKKGIRDINRGMSDISSGVADMKIASAKTPERALELMEVQRDRAAELALKHQAKAKGIFTGPAELRAAKAAEAKANSYQRKIDKLLKKHPDLVPREPAQAHDSLPVSIRLQELKNLHEQGFITDDEYQSQRESIIADV